MSNIVEFPNTETIHYEMDGDAITGVNYKKGFGSALGFSNNGKVNWGDAFSFDIPKKDLERLMIAWLALNNPDVLKFDD
tara:strand:+ start:280 stop:516 length:237 start_codon:yes stop_codon:yes gene_type:complete